MRQGAMHNVSIDVIDTLSTMTNRCNSEHLTKHVQFGMGNGSVLESQGSCQIDQIDPAV